MVSQDFQGLGCRDSQDFLAQELRAFQDLAVYQGFLASQVFQEFQGFLGQVLQLRYRMRERLLLPTYSHLILLVLALLQQQSATRLRLRFQGVVAEVVQDLVGTQDSVEFQALAESRDSAVFLGLVESQGLVAFQVLVVFQDLVVHQALAEHRALVEHQVLAVNQAFLAWEPLDFRGSVACRGFQEIVAYQDLVVDQGFLGLVATQALAGIQEQEHRVSVECLALVEFQGSAAFQVLVVFRESMEALGLVDFLV